MGNNSSHGVRKIFARLDSENSGVISLDQLFSIHNPPEVEHWSNTHSPLLLFRFDETHEGCLDYEEFSRLIKYLNGANKKFLHLTKKQHSLRKSSSQVWTCVSQLTAQTIKLDRDEPPPVFTGRRESLNVSDSLTPPPSPSTTEEQEIEEEQFTHLVHKEAKEFFSKLLKTKEGRIQFLNWLFLLGDVDDNKTIGIQELSLVIAALSHDGIMPSVLTADAIGGASNTPDDAARNIIEEYGTDGILTYDEFMVFGDLILKCYEGQYDNPDDEERIGKYRLKRKIGKGASGVVWMGIDNDTQQKKAIKAIPVGDISDMSRLDVEIKAMLMLKHPNIVMLDEVLETEETVFFVMELCGGGTLAERIGDGPLKEDVARFYFLGLLDAVKYCHTVGVVHRDLKLENVLLDNNGNVKVADFGHAGIFSTGWDLFSTGMMGSLGHLSPEQIEGQCYSGEKIDIWALGVLLYRLVVGNPPFWSSDPKEFVDSIRNLKYEIPDHLSPEVINLLTKILRTEPEKRLPIDLIKLEPWCAGSKLQPTLLQERIYLEPWVDWEMVSSALSKVGQKHIHMLDHIPPPTEPLAHALVKCLYPAKEVKFNIMFKVDPERDDQTWIEFNLKQGESMDFYKIVNRIRKKLTIKFKLPIVRNLNSMMLEDHGTNSESEFPWSSSEGPTSEISSDDSDHVIRHRDLKASHDGSKTSPQIPRGHSKETTNRSSNWHSNPTTPRYDLHQGHHMPYAPGNPLASSGFALREQSPLGHVIHAGNPAGSTTNSPAASLRDSGNGVPTIPGNLPRDALKDDSEMVRSDSCSNLEARDTPSMLPSQRRGGTASPPPPDVSPVSQRERDATKDNTLPRTSLENIK